MSLAAQPQEPVVPDDAALLASRLAVRWGRAVSVDEARAWAIEIGALVREVVSC